MIKKRKRILKKNRLEEIRKYLVDAALKQNLTQKEILDKCIEAGYEISQSEISRLFSGQVTVSLYQAIALADVLDISLDDMAVGRKEKNDLRLQVEGRNFITNPQSEEFKGYMGRYMVYFQSTSQYEEKLLCGELVFEEDNIQKKCIATLVLDTGQTDAKGVKKIKKYSGQIIISNSVSAVYCILASSEIGELCMLELRFRKFNVQEVACKGGLAITVSAGDRNPTVHRMLVSRKKLDGDEAWCLVNMLRMESDIINIPTYVLEKLADERPEYQALISEIYRNQKQEMYELNIRTFLDKRMNDDRKERLELLAELKTRCNVPWMYQNTVDDDRYLYYLHSIYSNDKH